MRHLAVSDECRNVANTIFFLYDRVGLTKQDRCVVEYKVIDIRSHCLHWLGKDLVIKITPINLTKANACNPNMKYKQCT